jgi:hypothetical protein
MLKKKEKLKKFLLNHKRFFSDINVSKGFYIIEKIGRSDEFLIKFDDFTFLCEDAHEFEFGVAETFYKSRFIEGFDFL